jgi:hypothetical protein
MTSERYALTRAFHGAVKGWEPEMAEALRPPGVIADLGARQRRWRLEVVE